MSSYIYTEAATWFSDIKLVYFRILQMWIRANLFIFLLDFLIFNEVLVCSLFLLGPQLRKLKHQAKLSIILIGLC